MPRFPRFRFRLRTLLLLFVAVAVFCWWKDKPRRLAVRFVSHVNAGEYADADDMVVERKVQSSTVQNPVMAIGEFMPGEAQLHQRSLRDWWRGEVRVLIRTGPTGGQESMVLTQSLVVSRNGVSWNGLDFAPANESRAKHTLD